MVSDGVVFFQRGIFKQTLVLLDLLCNLIFYVFISDDNNQVDIHHLVNFCKYLYKRKYYYVHVYSHRLNKNISPEWGKKLCHIAC